MMLMRVVMLLLCLVAALPAGAEENKAATKTLIVYSELEPKFTQDLLAAYNKLNQDKVVLEPLYQLEENSKADIVLAEQRTLNGLKVDGRLRSFEAPMRKVIEEKFQDKEHFWLGAFYDPAVLLVNQTYARERGQKNIKGWQDLENSTSLRLVQEGFANSNDTRNFLGAFASNRGESATLSVFWNLHRFVNRYASFPFAPIRMVAFGEADVAITRQSYVYKYLENNFPAYVVMPREGTPVNLYCMGLFKECKDEKAAVAFSTWLIQGEEVQRLAVADETGLMFLEPKEGDMDLVPEALWLNKDYLLHAPQEALVQKWIEGVRFSRN